MMKVLVVGPSPERSKGGMATVIKEIKNDPNLSENCNIEIFESFVDGNKIKRALYSIFSFEKFCITKHDYDIYHIHAASRGSTFRKGYYVNAAKRWGKKVVFHIHGAQYVEFYDGLSEKKKKRVVNILKKSDCVIALSKEWKEKFDDMFGLTNCVVLENGIDTCSYEIARTRPEQNLKSFLMLGRMGQRKGTYDLIDAVSQAVKIDKDLVFYLAGDGEVDNVKKVVREKNLENNIIVVGWADFSKKISLLQNVSTVILPSYNEGLPMAVLEGMASGKAIISTTVGAIPEVIDEGNGILVPPGDIKALSEAIIKCSFDIRMVQEMSENNIKKIQERYSSNAMHEKLKMIYQNVWGGKTRM